MKSKYVATVHVIDPDTKLPCPVEIRKLEDGTLVGLDGAFLESDHGVFNSPYDSAVVEVPDDEQDVKEAGPVFPGTCYIYTLLRGAGDDLCQTNFFSPVQVDWHAVVRAAIDKMGEDFEFDEVVAQIEQDNPLMKSLCRDDRPYCNIDLLDFDKLPF